MVRSGGGSGAIFVVVDFVGMVLLEVVVMVVVKFNKIQFVQIKFDYLAENELILIRGSHNES